MKCRCNVCEAERMRAYRKTPKWREAKRKYSASEAGKAARRRYKTGEAGRAAARRYKKGESGKAASERYFKGDAGRAAVSRHRRNKRKRDIHYRISQNLSSMLRQSLRRKGTRKSNRTIELLGCSKESFKIYIESLWEFGMSWENYGKMKGQWAIDHIVPVSLFDMKRADHVKRCFHFSNMQPMWQLENIRKSNYVKGGGVP